MAVKSIRIMVRMVFPSKTIRLWDGAGPCMDSDGEIWSGCALSDGLDPIESAMNGEAATLTLGLSGIDPRFTDLAYQDMDAGEVIGSKVHLLIQPCDDFDQPVGPAEVRFTGTVDNMPSDESVSGDQMVSAIALEITNRFDLRTLVNGAVLSDVDQRARSRFLNPAAWALGLFDRFCERIPGLSDKTIVWPRYS